MKKITLLIMFLPLLGCATTPTGDISAFGTATKGVTDKIDSVIKEYNDANIQDKINGLAQHTKTIQMIDLKPIGDAIIQEANKNNYALYKANNALGGYANALTMLASAGSREDIDLASAKLYSSLQGFNSEYKVLKNTKNDLIDDKTSAMIGTVVAAIGNIYIEKERAKAIKTIVIAADQPVQIICDTIKDELLKGVIEDRLHTISYTDLGGLISDYNKIVSKASYSDKVKALDEIYNKYEIMQASSASIVSAVNAMDEIKKAHATLKSDVQKNNFTSANIEAEIANLKDLKDHYGKLDNLLLTCKTQLVDDPQKGIICK